MPQETGGSAKIDAQPEHITGGDAVAQVLAALGIRTLWTYPGTSELPLCEAVVRLGSTEVINARGDAEAVFLAAGANIDGTPQAACLLHGARGLTNALGALADVARNEIPLLVLTGLPATSSAKYLPPHAEPSLIPRIGSFAKFHVELQRPNAAYARAGERFVSLLNSAHVYAFSPPFGPSLVGIPHDVLAERWVDQPICSPSFEEARRSRIVPKTSPSLLREAVRLLRKSQRPLILIDDYLFRHDRARFAISAFAESLDAPVLQIRYDRGPMLFEMLSTDYCANFVGRYAPADGGSALSRQADLVVTVEDRNMYPRVIGPQFGDRHLAITSNAPMTRKNDYLQPSDLLVEGPVVDLLLELAREDLRGEQTSGRRWVDAAMASAAHTSSVDAAEWRRRLVAVIAAELAELDNPVLVDDSQMFGGLVAESYDLLPSRVRVFGDHGGFVGAGLALATGAALARPEWSVLACVGDHGFTNGFKALFAAADRRANVSYIVCNNGGSVSLKKQARADYGGISPLEAQGVLANVNDMDYARVAAAVGTWSVSVEWPRTVSDRATRKFQGALRSALQEHGPSLLELRVPEDVGAWSGIWRTRGFDEPGATGAPVGITTEKSGADDR